MRAGLACFRGRSMHTGVVPESSILFYLALRKAKVLAQVHVSEKGPTAPASLGKTPWSRRGRNALPTGSTRRERSTGGNGSIRTVDGRIPACSGQSMGLTSYLTLRELAFFFSFPV